MGRVREGGMLGPVRVVVVALTRELVGDCSGASSLVAPTAGRDFPEPQSFREEEPSLAPCHTEAPHRSPTPTASQHLDGARLRGGGGVAAAHGGGGAVGAQGVLDGAVAGRDVLRVDEGVRHGRRARELLVEDGRRRGEQLCALRAAEAGVDRRVVEAALRRASLRRGEGRRAARLVHAREEGDLLRGGRALERAQRRLLVVTTILVDARAAGGVADGRVELEAVGLAEGLEELDEAGGAELHAPGSARPKEVADRVASFDGRGEREEGGGEHLERS